MKAIGVLFVLAAAPAFADPQAPAKLEVGVALGGHAFSSDVELGVPDMPNEPSPVSGAMFGARIAVPLSNRLAIEGEAMVIPTKDDVLHDAATVYGLRAHVRLDLLTGKLRPFLVAGAGMHVLRSSSPQMANDVDQAYHVGAGIRYAVSDRFDVRFDARDLFVPDRDHNGATEDYEFTAGVTWRFGVTEPAAPAPATEPAPGPVDTDGDGLTDDVDKCPTQAEDKDGFQDEDGCPDPDNDNDGIPDVADKCPNEPETKNGYQDEDGCPDQVIRELAGIGFELDSAKIDEQSAPILEKAVDILKANPSLAVEISGHTSAEGNRDRNEKLSLARAEAVKAYLVKRGIAATRILTVGHGSDVPVADNGSEDGRRQNRRIEFRVLTPDDLKLLGGQ